MGNSCYTYFRIVGNFEPDEVTAMLKLSPYKTKIGDGFSGWYFGLCNEYDVFIENQMRKTIAPLKDKVDILNSIREQYDAQFYLEIVPEIYVDEINPVLAPPLDVMEFCVSTKTEIDIDYYIYTKEDAEN